MRASYGVTGNDRIPDYLYLTTILPTRVTLDGTNLYAGVTSGNLPNPDLQWESTAQFDVGFDIGFINDRITSTFDYYKKNTNKLLFDIPIGIWQGFDSQTVNTGSIENHGVELTINTENIVSSSGFNWNTGLNVSYNKQTCTDLGGRPYIITQIANPNAGRAIDFTKLEVGGELSQIYGYVYTGPFKTGDDRSAQPGSQAGDASFKDISGPNGVPDGIITSADRTYLGNGNPHWIFGLNNEFRYKGLSLNVFFQGATGYKLYNVSGYRLEEGEGKEVLGRWTTENEDSEIPRNGYLKAGYGLGPIDRFVQDASYLRMKVLTIGYDFKVGQGTSVKFLKTAKVYVSGQNLLTITNYKGADPEVNSQGGNNNLRAGEDFTAFPAYKIFTFGAQINF